MPAGFLLDGLTEPEHFWPFLWIRLGASAAAVALLGLSYVGIASQHVVLLGAGPPLVCATAIELMVLRLGGYASPYYAGLNLCILAVGVLYTWRWWQAAAVSGAVVGVWLAPTLASMPSGTIDARAFFNNFYFLLVTAVIAVASSVVRLTAARREFRTQAELARATQNLSEAFERMQELDRFKSEFFANVTHELKTPLTMILAPLELMVQGEMGKLTEAQRATLSSMLRNGVKLLTLIGDLLDLSKVEESRLRLQIAEHDLVSYLTDLVAEVRPLAQRKSIELSFSSNVEVCRVFCDLERLERVFVNLLSNAAKFTPPQGKIAVTFTDRGETVRISVADTGIGFPEELAERVFERFFQVDMAGTRKVGGTGIGLALARELVHLHGGEINALSRVSEGATFTVELKKGRDHFDPERIDRRARRESRGPGVRSSDHSVGDWQVDAKSRFRLIEIDEATDQRVVARDVDEDERGQSVLVVEDTPDVIRVIHLALRNDFRVVAAPDGKKGLELAKKHLPSLVITDLMMPEMDGIELTRLLRTDAQTRHIPIVMLTARGDLDDRVAGLDAGVNAYLAKPFSAKELLSTVRSLVRIQETTADLVLTHNMDSLETIAGGLAHEINNPLNYIKNALTLIQRDADAVLRVARAAVGESSEPSAIRATTDGAARMTKMFDVADSGLKRIGATVNLMQRYAREGYSRAFQPLDIFEATRDVAAVLQAGLSQAVVEMAFEGDGVLECVPEEMNQVLTNLIQNALDALPKDGTGWVRVNAATRDGVLSLSIRDNGSGIRPEERTKIFTPFFTTKDVGAGMGLGLSIVHRVVSSLGGTVGVTSELGEGTEFTLRIPQTGRRRPTPRLDA
ncbi:MAG TPA: ATP-binding protein [Polyangiaceae bacterium]|jgi:signal transduction histidine kinase|nr:ATP-binding protein [Polyangiaceae bacterium]